MVLRTKVLVKYLNKSKSFSLLLQSRPTNQHRVLAAPHREKQTLHRPSEIDKTCGAQRDKLTPRVRKTKEKMCRASLACDYFVCRKTI